MESAKRYQLTGRPFGEICEHNAEVAMDLDRPLVAQTWKMLKLLYSNSISMSSTDPSRSSGSDGLRLELEKCKFFHSIN